MMRPPKYLMNNTMTVEAKLKDNPFGQVYDDPIEADIYNESTQKKITDNEGNEIIATGFAISRDEINIPAESRITINGQKYEVAKVKPFYPLGKFSHIEVYYK